MTQQPCAMLGGIEGGTLWPMRTNVAAIIGVLAGASGALAQSDGIQFSLSEGLQAAASQPESSSAPPVTDAGTPTGAADAPIEGAPIRFGLAGARLWSVGGGYMNNFKDDQAGEFYLGYSHFLADHLEFNLELGGWYFNQDGDDTGGISPIMNFRWHFLHDEEYDWSIFGELGIGVLFAFDNVPSGGTGFNFVPRVGAGFTKQLNDSGLRLMAGVRWQHISNGRIEGDDRNPARDSLMGYVGVMVPF